MIIKIHSRGVGSGSGPVDYLLGKDRDREDARLDRGDPEQMVQLIDSTNFAQKYTSGVLSFAERDLDEHQKQQIMDSFERALMPGMDKDQYSILWVQHQDKDRLELNFVVANVELQSGKRLQPYYDKADRPRLNAWKDLVNDHYDLKDPNDPLNKRELCTPNNLPRTKIKACEAITDGLLSVAERGDLKNRDDVIKTLEGAGFEIARTTKKSISIKDPDGGQNIRLKGAIYEQDFRFGKELRADIEQASERYRASRGDRVQEARATLDRLVERKRASNEIRYPRAEQTPIADYVKNLEHRSHSHRDSAFADVGHPNLSEQENSSECRDYGSTEPSYPRVSGQGGQYQARGLHRQEESQTPMRSSEQGRRELEQWQSNDSDGVLTDDRIRKALTRSLRTSTGTATAEGSRFTQDVREYQAGQSQREANLQRYLRNYEGNRPDPKRELEQISSASKQLELSSARLQDTKQSLDRAITGIRNASQQVKEMNTPKQSYYRGR
ncbi:relaxase/mobilization nuclease domain-containing protein [Acinetobacter towneri]|nr:MULTISPECIES: relaxase/mobilization nuclease domain-containing protein [Acinetobacter]MDM1748136.1 relaxase/mobilization nuclease domain-containing protein [Acinetobacter towneri]